MNFQSGTMMRLFMQALQNQDLQNAGTGFIRGVGDELRKSANAGDNGRVKRIAADLVTVAPLILGAMLSGTSAQAAAGQQVKEVQSAVQNIFHEGKSFDPAKAQPSA